MLQRNSRDATFIELRTLDLLTGKTDRPLPDRSVWQYDVSPDEREVAFTTRSANGAGQSGSRRSTAARLHAALTENGDDASFAGAEIVFRELDAKANYLTRIGKDGTARQRIVETPIIDKGDTSPDGAWVVADCLGRQANSDSTPGTTIRSLRGRHAHVALSMETVLSTFSADGRWLYVTLLGIGQQPGSSAKNPGAPNG